MPESPDNTIMSWIGYCLCMRNHPIRQRKEKAASQQNKYVYDAVIVWKEKSGSTTAFDVILEPAKRASPPKARKEERPLSAEIIQQKIKEAEERRLKHEAEKLEKSTAQVKRVEAAQEKVALFKKETEKRVKERLEKMDEKKTAHITAIQERVREHEKHVQEVRKNKENQPQQPIETC